MKKISGSLFVIHADQQSTDRNLYIRKKKKDRRQCQMMDIFMQIDLPYFNGNIGTNRGPNRPTQSRQNERQATINYFLGNHDSPQQ